VLWLLGGLALAALVLAAGVRLAPTDPARWHVDPTAADSPGEAGVLVRPGDGDIRPEGVDMAPSGLLARLDAIIRANPRTRAIAGSVEAGRITYRTRSRVFGFPDFATVTVTEEGGRAFPVILSRLRFGRSDLGVNRARVEGWLAELGAGG